MEDTVIIKTQYAYMLRADLPPVKSNTNVVIKDNLSAWIESSGCSFYLGCKEKGKETGKLHYQMIVWFEHKLSGKEMTKNRNWWRGKCGTHKNNHAFTSARKVATLASYSIKEDGEIITNLSKNQLKLVPLWKNKKALKECNKDKYNRLLAEKVEAYIKSPCNVQDIHQVKCNSPFHPFTKGVPDYPKFCDILDEAYFEVYEDYCCYRNEYFKKARKYGVISVQEFRELIGVIKPQFISPY